MAQFQTFLTRHLAKESVFKQRTEDASAKQYFQVGAFLFYLHLASKFLIISFLVRTMLINLFVECICIKSSTLKKSTATAEQLMLRVRDNVGLFRRLQFIGVRGLL